MSTLFQFLQKYEIPIYILLGLVGIIYIRKMALAWREWRIAMFGLEKEISQRKFATALTLVILILLIAVAEFALVSFVAPNFADINALSTPTIDLFTTGTPGLDAQATPAEGTPAVENLVGEGCIPGELEWTYPLAGDEVSGLIELKGTVNIANLGFYKYEFGQPGSDTWIAIAAGNTPIVDEPLGGIWNTEQLVPGEYSLRLVVYDSQNTALPTCNITVRVVAPLE